MASVKTSIKSKGSKATNKKQGKSKSEPELLTPDAWINELVGIEINDDEWKCSIVIIEETSTDASIYLDEFNNAAANGNRMAIKTISRSDVEEYVKKTIVKEHAKKATPLHLLCKEIYSNCGPDFEKMIPTSLIANLLKYIIIEYKELNKHIRMNLMSKNKELEDYLHSLWPSSSIKSASTKSGKTGAKSEASGKSKKSQTKTKAYTKLRKRGEEWKDQIWVEDAPIEGPQLYVVVTNFYDPALPLELLNLNMPLHAIVELEPLIRKSVNINTSDELHASSYNLNKRSNKMSKWFNTMLELKRGKIFHFWKEIEFLKDNLPTSLMFKDIIFARLVPDSVTSNDTLDFQRNIYKQISHFLYDIFENQVLHKKYLKALEITDVTDHRIEEPPNMQIYNSILDGLPHECLTIACVLDAILAQVCSLEIINSESQDIEEAENPQLANEKSHFLLELLQRFNVEYDIFQDPEAASNSFSTSSQSLSNPIKNVLIHSDDVSIKTFHLKRDMANYIKDTTTHILKSAWENFWIKHFVQHTDDNNFIKLCNVIITSDEAHTQHVLYYFVYIIIVNCILDSILMSSGFVPVEQNKPPSLINSSKEHDYSYNKNRLCDDCLHEIGSRIALMESLHRLRFSEEPYSSSHTSLYSLTSEIIANNLLFIEDMSADVLLQNLQMEFTRFSRFETRYCPFSDQLVVLLHDLLSLGESHEETWVGKLTTNVPVRDFVEYILEEEYSWCNDHIDSTPPQSLVEEYTKCVKMSDSGEKFSLSDTIFLSKKSLKYEHLHKMQFLESKGKGNDSQLRSLENINNQGIINIQGTGETENIEGSFYKTQVKSDFIGYELGEPQRFQFTGTVRQKLFGDNTKIKLQKVQKVYGDQSVTLNVSIDGHELFYNHKPNASSITPFHVILSSGIIFYFGNHGFQRIKTRIDSKIKSLLDPLPELQDLNSNSDETEEKRLKLKEAASTACDTLLDVVNELPHQVKQADFHSIPSVYNLKFSTPSGLHTEVVKVEEKDLLYVRQQLLSKQNKCEIVKKEKMRCYSSDGYIVKFMEGGVIEVLGGNGTIYSIYAINNNIDTKKDSEETEKLSLPGKDKLRKKGSTRKGSKKPSEATEKQEENLPRKTNSGRFLKTLEHEVPDYYLNLVNFQHTTSDGRRFVVNESHTKRIEDVLTMSSVDIINNRVNTERLDGLTSIHDGDGSLTVSFPDGSCITSIPMEADEIFCEWSTSEFDLWFTLSEENIYYASNIFSKSTLSDRIDSDEELAHVGNNSLDNHEGLPEKIITNIHFNSSERSLNSEKKNSIILSSVDSSNKSHKSVAKKVKNNKIFYLNDGFVVYTLNYFMEHPNYSSVYYDHNRSEIELKLPSMASIRLERDGSYRLLFDSINLMVTNNKIFLNKLDENGTIARTVVVNTKGLPDQEVSTERKIEEYFDKSIMKAMALAMKKKLLCEGLNSNLHTYLLYSVNEKGNETFIKLDDLKITEQIESISWNGIQGNEFCCFVINRDMSGFRLINSSDVGQYIQLALKNHGFTRKSENIWSTRLTSMPVSQNESQKWVLLKDNSNIGPKRTSQISTFGRRESWTKPFVKPNENDIDLTKSDVMIVRLLHKIPTEENIMLELKMVIEKFAQRSCLRSLEPSKFKLDISKGDLSLTEIVKDPSILHKIQIEESEKAIKEKDTFRKDMKNTFLRSLVRIACIKAKRIRQNMKVEEFKNVLRTKNIPPYHLSCFGKVHDILDEVLENVNTLRKTPSNFARVASVIDDILNLVMTNESEKDIKPEVTTTSTISMVKNIIDDIWVNFDDLARRKELICSILYKPLESVTSEEIDLLCQTFQSGAGDCPILISEEFILHDILEAGHQLSHYFRNLLELLEYYRNNLSSSSLNKKSSI